MENRDAAPEEIRGLPMVAKWDPEALAREKEELARIAAQPFAARVRGYWNKLGPGWLQSAMTLGSGSAAASLFAGAYLGYTLLWLQPVAMLLGIVVLSALAYQTLVTNVRPFDALRLHVSPVLAWAWVIASLLATVIWHFPQYALAGGMGQDVLLAVTGVRVPTIVVGFAVLAVSIWITWNYGSGAPGVRLYERLIKYMVWMIVLSFAVVILAQTFKGKVNWVEVIKGFVLFRIPRSGDTRGVSVLMAGFGAAVGINMTFLFGYTLLARGWGREHQGLARFDLLTGMFVPFAIATTLMILATASTIHGTEHVPAKGTMMNAVDAARVLEPAVGLVIARVVFGLGIIGMALSSITLHMLVCAFASCEIFGWEPTGWRYKIGSLIPVVGMLGSHPVIWKKLAFWVAIPTSAVCGLLLPIAYIGFFILHNSRSYLGEHKPAGPRAALWNLGMLLAIGASLSSAVYYIHSQWGWITGLFSKAG